MIKIDSNLAAALERTLILDRMDGRTARDPLYAFALDELLCRRTGQGGPSICHIWRHPSAFIMGLRDSRLPHAEEGLRWLESQGFQAAVRHSGGAAVPLDAGVVNISLILPMNAAGTEDYKQDFERMYQLLREAIGRRTAPAVDKGEIDGAYCPGDYDLSIDGFKFCGIAQRRQTNAFIVQAFVVAEGSGARRAGLVRDFYAIAAEGADSSQYPLVREDSTRSLEELAGLGPRSAEAFAAAVKETIRSYQLDDGLLADMKAFALPTADEIEAMADSLRSRYAIAAREDDFDGDGGSDASQN